MPTLKEEAKDGFHALYVNDGETLKGVFEQAKIVKEGDHTIVIYGIFESGLSVNSLPVQLSIHGKEYEGYDFKARKRVKKQPYAVEKVIFEQLNAEDFPASGFSCKFLHVPDEKQYDKLQPLSNIEACECPDLPPIPAGGNGNGRTYADPGESEKKRILARQTFLIGESIKYLETYGVSAEKVESIADLAVLQADESVIKVAPNFPHFLETALKLIQ